MKFWTDERVETLKRLWADGHGASEIARLMKADSRNVIIGKVHRLGLGGRAAPCELRAVETKREAFLETEAQRDKRRRSRVMPRVKGTVGEIPLPTPTPVVPTVNVHPKICGPDALLKRADRQCCFPIGEPRAADFHYCTNERLPGKSAQYCEAHQNIMDSKGAPKRSHDWYVERRAWAQKNPDTVLARTVLKYFESEAAA